MKNLKEAFGVRLREIRKSKGYTQEVLAEMIDISPRQLIRIENGENFPSSETLGKISLLLNTGLESLFDFRWNEDAMYFATGIYNRPSFKFIKNGAAFVIKNSTQSKSEELRHSTPISYEEAVDEIFHIAQKREKAVTVEYFENKKRISIKTFYPNGKVEEILSKEDIFKNEQYNCIITKLKKIASNSNKLIYVKLALESLEDKKSLEKLKILIQGIELTM